ncbi:MAG: glycoside hydrolase family 26 protein, partial [Duncaniella sp.]|nr:glycoside hydrolase family 26 protein [Duncaniella sp.]
MGEVAWGTGFCDLIKAESGKFPAIVGFDYIHLASSPANWIDYGDITPVKTVWDAGSIPAVTWHWNVPKNKPGTVSLWTGEVVMPSDWSGNVQLTDDNAKQLLSNVVAGAVISVKTKDVGAGAQGSIKNSGWSGLTPELDYFEITGDYTVSLTADMTTEVRNNGFIVGGHDYTVTEVSITIPAGGDTGYDASSEVFNAANVLVDGSWENQVALADVEKLAGYMTLLRDANIPVLFRPFHEAAGDYTWGSWFWWGNSGVDTTKQLWSWLYDKLTNQYGLNNLIWVWTVQTSDEGKLADISKLQAAYPGDALVDIVGVDLYVDPLTTQTAQFDLLYNLVGGKKLVALSECGNLLDVDAAFDDGALWSFFMGWYEQNDNGPAFIEWNTNGEWATVLNNPRVLNQGEFNLR